MSRLRRALVPVAGARCVGARGPGGRHGVDQRQAAPGDVTITGHGLRPRPGLSQWGAYGYATTHGWNHLQILAHYYSNASLGEHRQPDDQRPTHRARQRRHPGLLPGGVPAGWHLIQPGTVAQISRNGDGTWQLTTRYGCNGAVGGTATITVRRSGTVADPGNDVSRCCRSAPTLAQLPRRVRHHGTAAPCARSTTSCMQDYLRGVVPRESPASWGDAGGGRGMNALMAQAVAARSYA